MSRALRSLAVATLVASCAGDDDDLQQDGGATDAFVGNVLSDSDVAGDASPGMTEVTGEVNGTAFSLTFAAVTWEGDGVETLCVANRPITAPDCGYSDGMPKIVVRGALAGDGSTWQWGPPVELRVFGASPTVKIATGSSITMHNYDVATKSLQATIDAAFSGASAQGVVAITGP